MRVTTEHGTEGAAKKDILAALTGAQRELTKAYILATQANPMAADLPCFNRMRAIGTEITALMAEVSKVRGL